MNKKMYGFLLLVVTLLFVGAFAGLGQGRTEHVRIVGRIVGTDGKPLENADITYLPHPNADMGYSTTSGADGRFEIKTDGVGDEGTVWVTSNIDYHNWRPLLDPGVNLINKYLKRNKPIKLKATLPPNIIDLGDVPVMTYYTPIKVHVDAAWTDRIFNSGGDMELRVTDEDGEIANESIGGRGIDRKGSSMTLALPEGRWKVEVKTPMIPWMTLVDYVTLTGQTELSFQFPVEK